MNNTIIIGTGMLKTYECLQELVAYADKDDAYINELWQGLLQDEALMKEFQYYLEKHTLLDAYKCEGYGLTDIYVWEMSRYNLYHDIGKNTDGCDKDALVLETFYDMVELKKNPKAYIRRLTEDPGMDKM